MYKKCLITGGSGFIGSALKIELIKRGYNVVALPRQLLFKPKLLEKFVIEASPDLIFHLAAFGNKYFQKDENQIFETNIIGTFNLLNATKQLKFTAFINTGSSYEYGVKDKPMSEVDFLDTDTFYGVTKASATMLCRAFAKKYNKPIVTVRPFSVYGPNDDEEKFIPTVIRCATLNQNLKLASGVHDWIFIDDYINGVFKVVKNIRKIQGRVVNIGTGKQITNKKVVQVIEKVFGKKIKIERSVPIRNYDTNISWVADNKLLKSLGWKNKYDLTKGIKKTIHG